MSPRDRRAEYGTAIQFACRAIGNPEPEVTWYKEGKELRRGDGGGRVDIRTDSGFSYLSVDHVTEDDIGQYEAIGQSDLGQISSRFIVVVDEGPEEHFAPQFISPLKNQELPPNRNLLLHTKISASPYVAINWYRDGCKIRASSNVHKYFDAEGNATLALVNQDCTGSYTCVATNEGGENTIAVSVDPVEEQTHT